MSDLSLSDSIRDAGFSRYVALVHAWKGAGLLATASITLLIQAFAFAPGAADAPVLTELGRSLYCAWAFAGWFALIIGSVAGAWLAIHHAPLWLARSSFVLFCLLLGYAVSATIARLSLPLAIGALSAAGFVHLMMAYVERSATSVLQGWKVSALVVACATMASLGLLLVLPGHGVLEKVASGLAIVAFGSLAAASEQASIDRYDPSMTSDERTRFALLAALQFMGLFTALYVHVARFLGQSHAA